MGRAWSVFATPATELPKAFRAAVELDLNGGVLCLGPALSPRGAEAIWVAFAIEQGGDHFVEAVRSHDLPYSFFSTFSRLVTMYGTSNTDDLEIRWFQPGRFTGGWPIGSYHGDHASMDVTESGCLREDEMTHRRSRHRVAVGVVYEDGESQALRPAPPSANRRVLGGQSRARARSPRRPVRPEAPLVARA